MKIAISASCTGFYISPAALIELIKMHSHLVSTRKDAEFPSLVQTTPHNNLHDIGDGYNGDYFSDVIHKDGISYFFNGAHEYNNNKARSDPGLISVIERLGKKANGKHAILKVVEIPDDVDYEIEERHDGERIIDKNRIWK